MTNDIFLYAFLYKIASLAVGTSSLYMGYRLFVSGIWGNAGELSTKFDKNSLVLKNGAPGTFFALFGTVVLLMTLWKGFDLNEGSAVVTPAHASQTTLPETPPVSGDMSGAAK